MTTTNPLIAALSPITSRVRQDVTAVRRAEGGSIWTEDPLTPERMAAHLAGGAPRGVCPIKAGESTTMLGLLDFDSHGGEVSWSEMAILAQQVQDTLDLVHGAPSVAFRSSGGRGIHLYVLWETPQDAYSARQWLAGVLGLCGLKSGTKGVIAKQVEVFPKQDHVAVGKCGNQFILPLAGKSELLLPCELSGMLVPAPGGRDAVLDVGWNCAPAVPVLERPVRVTGTSLVTSTGETPLWRMALDAIHNGQDATGAADGTDLDYDQWRNIVFAIHSETGGSDEGLALATTWSARSPKFDADFLENRVWPYIQAGGGITGGTILSHAARVHGWTPPIDDSAFEVIPDDTRPAPVLPGRPAAGAKTPWPTDAGIPVPQEPRGGAQEQSLTSPGAADADGGLPMELPIFERKKNGSILPIFENAVLAIERADLTGWDVKCDTFRDEVMVLPPAATDWRPWKASDVGELRVALKNGGFESCAKDVVRDALHLVAARREYDSAQLWLSGLEPHWDGLGRCETFLIDYWGAADTPYTRAVARYLWTALAGRVISPGCQADMAPVFEGHQGLRKTSGIAALVPDFRLFAEVDLTKDDTDLARVMRGTLVCEISELKGLYTRDQESIKAFVSRRHEKWTPKYVEQSTIYQRRAILIGSTNKDDILADETGNRRWLPLHVERVDVEGIEAARDQLWAEAAARYRAGGVDWRDAETLGSAEHAKFMFSDSWEEAVVQWLDNAGDGHGGDHRGPGQPDGEQRREGFTTDEVMSLAIGIPRKDANMAQQRRLGAILRKLGYVKKRTRIKCSIFNTWERA